MSAPKKKIKLASISLEVAPFAKAGGLGDVAGALPLAFKQQRQQPIIFMPYFAFSKHRRYGTKKQGSFKIAIDPTTKVKVNYYATTHQKVPVYFVDVDGLFRKHQSPYKNKQGTNKGSAKLYYFWSVAVLELILKLNLKLDIIHLHDYHVGLIAQLIKTRYSEQPLFTHTKVVYNIHNLQFQLEKPSKLPQYIDRGQKIPKANQSQLSFASLNFTKRAFKYADLLVTVSPQYAKEIQTKEFGFKLQKILQKKASQKKLIAILNGIDNQIFNPETDPNLKYNYTWKNHKKNRQLNKTALQKISGLEADPKKPLLGIVSRITTQKGFDLLLNILPNLATAKVQLILVGSGDPKITKQLKKWEKKTDNFKFWSEFNIPLASQVYSAADIFLMPSKFEPCGLGQLIALRYGAIPVVSAVGGLNDTTTNYSPRHNRGNGFKFKPPTSEKFQAAIYKALRLYHQPARWNNLIKHNMKLDYSWEKQAVLEYQQAFIKLINS